MSATDADEIDRQLAEYGYPPILCQARVAKILEVTTRTVRNYETEGRLRPLRPTRHPRYMRREVARFLAARG